MNHEQLNLRKKIIWQALIRFRDLFNKSPEPNALELYAETLASSYEVDQVTWALTQIIKTGNTFYPSCGEIFKVLTPRTESKEDVAPRIVEEMLGAIRDFSQYDEEKMIASVSEEARLAFQMLGSTYDIRISEEIEIVKAQLRGLVKSVISSRDANVQSRKLETIGISSPTGMAKIDFNSIAGEAISGRI